MVSVADRVPADRVETVNLTVPVPMPLGVVGTSHVSLETAVQKHSLGATTLRKCDVLDDGTTKIGDRSV